MYQHLIEFARKTTRINHNITKLLELSGVLDASASIRFLEKIAAESELDARADFQIAIKAQDKTVLVHGVTGDLSYPSAIIRTYLDCVVVTSRWSRTVYSIDDETGQLEFKHFTPDEELMLEARQSWSEVRNPIPF